MLSRQKRCGNDTVGRPTKQADKHDLQVLDLKKKIEGVQKCAVDTQKLIFSGELTSTASSIDMRPD